MNPRKLTERRIVIASHNEGKIYEITTMLSPFGKSLESSRSLQLIEPDETGSTYLENALQKAHAASDATGLVVLADDSGIEVDALGGEPGLHTAPFTHAAGGRHEVFRQWAMNEAIRENPQAHFVCVQVLLWPDGHYESFLGRVSGMLTFPPRGEHGHGYDPIFIPHGFNQTLAQMSTQEKNTCSHRFIALNRLIDACIKAS